MTTRLFKQKILNFFESYPIVNLVYWGDDSDFNAIPDKKYKAVQLELLNSQTLEFTKRFQVNISIMDLMNVNNDELPTNDYKSNIQSDCELLVDEFINQLNIGNIKGIQLIDSGICYPFEDSTDDITAGVSVSVTLEVDFIQYC